MLFILRLPASTTKVIISPTPLLISHTSCTDWWTSNQERKKNSESYSWKINPSSKVLLAKRLNHFTTNRHHLCSSLVKAVQHQGASLWTTNRITAEPLCRTKAPPTLGDVKRIYSLWLILGLGVQPPHISCCQRGLRRRLRLPGTIRLHDGERNNASGRHTPWGKRTKKRRREKWRGDQTKTSG